MVSLVLSAVIALASHTGSLGAHSSGQLPPRGVIVPGAVFAGVHLGDTQQKVQAVWGHHYDVCGHCKDRTWLYEYRGPEPLGAAVRFQRNRVVAVFSLGSPVGWKTTNGLNMGDPISSVYSQYPSVGTTRCIGFDAITTKIGTSVMAFYSAAGVIYGFAMVVPKMTVCQ